MMTPTAQHNALSMFAQTCHKVLEANMHKGGWDQCDPSILMTRVREEMIEVEWELHKQYADPDTFSIEKVERECADVANMIMMVYDSCRRLHEVARIMETENRIPKENE